MNELQAKWNAAYGSVDRQPEPARVLTANAHLLPAAGTALDLACGLGGNALFLARRGLQVTAWDFSEVAIERLHQQARSLGLALTAELRDVEREELPEAAFDVIVVSRFLTRRLADAIVAALRPGGLLYYQTYTRAKLTESGPNNLDYLLEDNELLRLFAALRLRYYREDDRCGDLAQGLRDEAYYVGCKEVVANAKPRLG
jgi:SAM-dependent methyltransferase